ncbi:enzymatic polyprotein endonuclease reverse [Vespula squamosa]|uniref:Enzymatic polyprotein endonuclease reverse n=1 Tax=Vespula squamosa TaxID=30214 RepID=A0ABD2BGB3_VESSQ
MSSDKTSHIKSTNKVETVAVLGVYMTWTSRILQIDSGKKSSPYKNKNALFANTKTFYNQWRESPKLLSDAQTRTTHHARLIFLFRKQLIWYHDTTTTISPSVLYACVLSGQAYLAVEDYKIRTINKLCDVLREEFDCNKTLYQYKAKLSSIYMKRLDFIERVKDLHQAICDEEWYKGGKLMDDRHRETDEFALTNFYEGLPLEYRLRITPDTCKDLLEAFAKGRKFHSKADDYLLCDKIKLSGITSETIMTYSSCTLDIYGHPVEFHLVSNSFPIPHGGILGADFFKNSAKINFMERNVSWKEILMPFVGPEEKTVAGRICDVLKVNILHNEVKTGYIPALNLGDSIYASEAIVTHCNGQTNIKVFNTNEEEVKIKIPKVLLEEFEVVNEHDVPSLGHDANVVNTRQLSPAEEKFPFIEICDRITMYNGHVAYFTSVRGAPLNIGAKELVDNRRRLLSVFEVTLGRVKVTKRNEKYFIALPVKEKTSILKQVETLDEALHSLLDTALEL